MVKQGWDEPAQASSPRGWLHAGGTVTGFYLDYGPDNYRTGHTTEIYPDKVVSFCQPGKLCRECQPGNVLAVRYPAGPGTDQRSRYVETVGQAREWVESGELARVVLRFPGFPPVQAAGPVITAVTA